MGATGLGSRIGATAVVVLASLVLATNAFATPSVTFTPSFGAGSRLSEPGTANANLTFTGTEFQEEPEPLTALTLHLPAGTTLSNSGFPTCDKSVLIELGPKGCPAGSSAGPQGSFKLIARTGVGKHVEEPGTTEAFFAPGGGFNVWLFGHEPVIFELVIPGTVEAAEAPFGPRVTFSFPVVEALPGVDFSYLGVDLDLGATLEEGLISSLTPPGECTAGHLNWAADAGFNEAAEKRVGTVETACPPAANGEVLRKLHEAEARKHAAEAAAKKVAEEAEAKRHAEEAAAKQKTQETHASIKIVKVKVGARKLAVTLKLSTAATVTITGPGLKKLVVHLAAGSHTVNVALTKAGVAERRARKRIKLSVAMKAGSTTVLASQKLKL